eukprot:CCRYP_011066-RA/>CCRYP_011066-RA protein AED:0.02 eAED:0.02 QI:141/1/1/1/1/1/2/1040/369
MSSNHTPPTPIAIATDPRFILARKLITSGSPASAIDIFAALHENCCHTLGDDSLGAALCQYEYGNALFRSALRDAENGEDGVEGGDEHDGDEDKKPAAKLSDAERQREVMAAAAEKRARGHDDVEKKSTDFSNKRIKIENVSENTDRKENDAVKQDNVEDANGDDVSLALEMMESSFNILYSRVEAAKTLTTNSEGSIAITNEQNEWALDQIPRILICIGDVHSFRKQHGNAVDAYCRALPYREERWKNMKNLEENVSSFSIEQLQCHRRLLEVYTLVAEALLACPDGHDAVCENDGKPMILVKAAERMDFIHSYYELARKELEDLLYRMGKMIAAQVDIAAEKSDICVLVEMVTGVGLELAALEEAKK